MDDWEDESAVRSLKAQVKKWEGEDADDFVADSWEEEIVEEVRPETQIKMNGTHPHTPRKKQGKQLVEACDQAQLPGDALADKLHRQKLQEESDLLLAKEVFGVDDDHDQDDGHTQTDPDYLKTKFAALVAVAQKNNNFASFAEDIVLSISNNLTALELKRITFKLSNLQIQKTNAEKGEKKKNKAKHKAKLRIEGDMDYSEYSAYTEDCDDDYI